MKEIVGYILLFLALVVFFPLHYRARIYCLLALVFYPIVLKVFDRDAFTVSTVLIYICALPSVIRSFATRRDDSMNMHALLLIVFAIASTAQLFGNMELFLPAVRQLSNFISSIFVFILIINTPFLRVEDLSRYIKVIFSVLIFSTVVQCAISIIMYIAPSTRQIFSVFSYGTATSFEAVSVVATFTRLNSLIMPFEAMSEFIATLSPILLYRFFDTKRIYWLVVYVFMFFVLCLNQTRSGFILFLLGCFLYLLINVKLIGARVLFNVTIVGFVGFLFALEFSNTLFTGIVARLEQTSSVMDKSSTIFKVINREGFYYNMDYLLDSLKPFGHGLISPIFYKIISYHFHNLGQTIIFQFGYVGAIFVFAMFLRIGNRAVQYWNSTKHTQVRLLGSAILLSVLLFFVNETKYEFNRYEGYQQVIWAYLAAIYLQCYGSLSTKTTEVHVGV